MNQVEKIKFNPKGNLINGIFQKPIDSNGEWINKSPADFSDEMGWFQYSYSSVDEAVQSAKNGYQIWRKTPLSQRIQLLKNYQNQLSRRESEIVEAIAREVGKPCWEAKTEFEAMLSKIDITIEEGLKFVSQFEIPQIMEGTTGVCRFKSLGIIAVIGSFNFPGHLPNGHIVPALLTGNSVIFKPSEKAPIVAQLMAECFVNSEFPPGVVNVIFGEKEIGRRLCAHEGIHGIAFTGSYEVGLRIKQETLHQHWKLIALEMGGKNSAIIWDDAHLETTVYETLVGAFQTTGQRCSSTSRIIVQKKVLEEFLHRFHQQAKAFKISHPFENPFMGPLVEQGAVDRYMKFLGIALREGCEMVMRGKSLDLAYQGNYVTPSICLTKEVSLEQTRKSVYQQTELFAPNVVILPVNDLEEAIAQANATQFGLVASVFTNSQAVYDKCWEELDVGLLNWNKSTHGASSRLPFGGIKKSGNYFPSAIFATHYCTYPVASLEAKEAHFSRESAMNTPGLNWRSWD